MPSRFDPLFAVVVAIIDPLDGERIAARGGRLGEADAVVTKVAGRLGVIPFELHSYGVAVVMSTCPADAGASKGPLGGWRGSNASATVSGVMETAAGRPQLEKRSLQM